MKKLLQILGFIALMVIGNMIGKGIAEFLPIWVGVLVVIIGIGIIWYFWD